MWGMGDPSSWVPLAILWGRRWHPTGPPAWRRWWSASILPFSCAWALFRQKLAALELPSGSRQVRTEVCDGRLVLQPDPVPRSTTDPTLRQDRLRGAFA